MNGAQLLVQCLEKQGVEYIFGIPGAKVDAVFNALVDSNIRLIVCRHEQNAVFMAEAYGRLTGRPGVVLVTSGPGITNMTTGLLTATTEGDPVVAIGGNVPRAMLLRGSHQSAENVKIMEAVTKSSVSAEVADSIPEMVANAFRVASMPRSGACFISVPQDVLAEKSKEPPIARIHPPTYGNAPQTLLKKAAQLINNARLPLILLGAESTREHNVKYIRALLRKTPLPVIVTYQGAGVINKDLLACFAGRVGLFKNQPGDKLIDQADVILTIGFNTVEYDPEIWNSNLQKSIIHLDYNPCYVHSSYQPVCELIGDIAANIASLSRLLHRNTPSDLKEVTSMRHKLEQEIAKGKEYDGTPIHPLRFIYELSQVIKDDTTICCDIGSFYIWMARYFFSYRPHQLLFSNGQQTLGVGMPWAMGAHFARPSKPVISISGDGGFLFSATELETAVREKIKLIHFIWRDGTYNMVLEQEFMKYQRKSGVDLGRVHIPDFAKAFGAVGYEMTHPAEFQALYKKALDSKKPVLIEVPIDYSDNPRLFKSIDPNSGH